MAALCLTTSSLSFKSAPQNVRIDAGKIKLKVKYVKQKNFTFTLKHPFPYPCTFFPFPISLYSSPCTFFPISLYLVKHIKHKKAVISVTYRPSTFFPHIPVPFPIFLDLSSPYP